MKTLLLLIFAVICHYQGIAGDLGERSIDRAIQSLITQETQNIRKELTGFRKELMNYRNEYKDLQNKLEYIQKNPVPIGFIYVQLSNQPPPSSLWPKTEWKDISSTYAGLFFRAVGGTSASFGETQNENSPRIIEIKNESGTGTHRIDISPNGDWTLPLWTGGDTWCINPDKMCYWSMFFKQSAGEVRPRNEAVQIWKRIN